MPSPEGEAGSGHAHVSDLSIWVSSGRSHITRAANRSNIIVNNSEKGTNGEGPLWSKLTLFSCFIAFQPRHQSLGVLHVGTRYLVHYSEWRRGISCDWLRLHNWHMVHTEECCRRHECQDLHQRPTCERSRDARRRGWLSNGQLRRAVVSHWDSRSRGRLHGRR